jgi:hypothetical protein
MAAPHVSGTIALILSGKPALLGDPNNYQAVTNAVRVTAINHIDNTCGGDEDGDPNNVYGDGRDRREGRVDLVASGGTLSGTITDVDTNAVDRRRDGHRERRRARVQRRQRRQRQLLAVPRGRQLRRDRDRRSATPRRSRRA